MKRSLREAPMPNPIEFLREAVKADPAVKYALGVGGIVAAIAIIFAFKIDPRVAVVGTIIMLILMGVLVIFARMSVLASDRLSMPTLVFTWFILLLFMAVSLSLFTSVFYQKPLDLSSWLTVVKPAHATEPVSAEAVKPLYGPTPIEPDATYRATVAWVNLKRCSAEICDVRMYLRAWETATAKILVTSSAVIPQWSEGSLDSLSEREKKLGIKPVSMRHPELEHGEIVFLGKDQVTVQVGCEDRQGKPVYGTPRDLDAHDLHSIFPIYASCGWVDLEMGFAIDRGLPRKIPTFETTGKAESNSHKPGNKDHPVPSTPPAPSIALLTRKEGWRLKIFYGKDQDETQSSAFGSVELVFTFTKVANDYLATQQDGISVPAHVEQVPGKNQWKVAFVREDLGGPPPPNCKQIFSVHGALFILTLDPATSTLSGIIKVYKPDGGRQPYECAKVLPTSDHPG